MAINRVNTSPPVTTTPSRPAAPAPAPPASGQQAVNDAVGEFTSTAVANDSRKPATTGTTTPAPAQSSSTSGSSQPFSQALGPTPGNTQQPATQQPVTQAPIVTEAPPPAETSQSWTPPSYGLPPFQMPQIGTDLSSSGGFDEPFGGKKEKTEEEEAEEAEKGGPSPF